MTEIAEVRKVAVVRQPPAAAFELFTAHVGAWWPLATHSVGLARATAVAFEPGVGGRIVETYGEGQTAVWGTVEVWDPPARLRFTWHPGTAPEEATTVEVTFRASADGTAVELVHRGWDRRPDGAAARANYERGWELVLRCYAERGVGALGPASEGVSGSGR